MREENKEKIEELISEFKGSKAYVLMVHQKMN